jgi:hypothetical protein
MRDGYAARKPRERASEGAGRIALDDQQIGPIAEQRAQRRDHLIDMPMRVGLSGTMQVHGIEAAKPELVGPEPRVLSRKHERRLAAASGQRMSHRCHLDRFRPGADDQPDISGTQYSP